MSNSKITGNFISDNFNSFLEILTDLYKINERAKIKITKDEILIYSTEGVNDDIHALKSYILSTSKYFQFKNELTHEICFIMDNIKRVIDHLKFIDQTKKIAFQFILDKNNNINLMKITDGIFAFSEGCSIGYKLRDLSIKQITKISDTEMADWKFKISNVNILNIKRLCKLNSANTVLNIVIKDGKIKFQEEDSWSIEVDNVSSEINDKYTFNKKYFYSILPSDEYIEMYMFGHYMLLQEATKNLMICFEKSI